MFVSGTFSPPFLNVYTKHVIANGKVTQERLKREDWTVPKVDGVAALSIGGVLTLGGELRVGRSKSGGFLGFGAKEDGNVVIGNNSALIVKSTNIGNGVVSWKITF